MAIMMPLVIPLADALSTSEGLGPERVDTILVGVVSSVFAGAAFGDHCSPISDTTILSSMASAADHIDVRTQLPCALLVALVLSRFRSRILTVGSRVRRGTARAGHHGRRGSGSGQRQRGGPIRFGSYDVAKGA